MIDHGDRLREAFETHEHLSPDPAEVYARVQELARTYRRRRRGAQVAGGAVLGAGLIVGAINLPGVLPAAPSDSGAAWSPAGAPSPTSTRVSEDERQKQWDAYFSAGYDYDDAVQLAKIWNLKGDIGAVKAEAGRSLLAGEALPIQPGSSNPEPDPVEAEEAAQVNAFFAGGYDYDDAVTLAKLWKTVDPYHAKIEGGKRLLAGETLPIKP